MNMQNTPKQDRKKLIELMKDLTTGMLTTVTEEGLMRSRPMKLAKVTDKAEVWFFVEKDADLRAEIDADPRVNLSIQDERRFVSLAGMAETTEDESLIEELHTPDINIWLFKGHDQEELALIRLVPFEGEYWDVSGINGLKFLFEQLRSTFTGREPNFDSNARVEL